MLFGEKGLPRAHRSDTQELQKAVVAIDLTDGWFV